jgi:phosphotransferase system  glucose/maltose/N-acetylglucosamine-specific IIC component
MKPKVVRYLLARHIAIGMAKKSGTDNFFTAFLGLLGSEASTLEHLSRNASA